MGILKKTKNTAEVPAVESKAQNGKTSARVYNVLVRPVLSEKATRDEQNGQYTFIVAMNTNKIEVKKAIFARYGVRPTRVNMINVEGKETRFGRTLGRRKDYKKAIVQLPKGQTISIHEGV